MHDLKALIADRDVLAAATAGLTNAVICPLTQGFALLPITDDLRSELEGQSPGDATLSAAPLNEIFCGLYALALKVSQHVPVAYASTEYFGGQGGQDAVVWHKGRATFSPSTEGYNCEWPNSAISQALREIGVARAEGQDEFDTIGLGRHRETHRWAAAHGTV